MLSLKKGDTVKTMTVRPRFVCSNYKGSFSTKWYHTWIVAEVGLDIKLEDKKGNTISTDLNGLGLAEDGNIQIYKINNKTIQL